MESETSTSLHENWKEEKEDLRNEIVSLQKEFAKFKKERKSEWKLFKDKFKNDLENIEKSLKNLKALHKKKEKEKKK
ncbi:MAG TPA: hypothetical protein DCR40_19565 [Prolixibacteraceae bacterium]|nr:hypothetical protein [Prolixibacteraceae bacterium]